jgi:hypothetical protein
MSLAGGVIGAAYVVLVPVVGEMVPHAGEQSVPLWLSVQLRLPLPPSLLVLPPISRVEATCTVPETTERETEIAGTVIVALADFVESAPAVAVRVTVRSFAGGPGAV